MHCWSQIQRPSKNKQYRMSTEGFRNALKNCKLTLFKQFYYFYLRYIKAWYIFKGFYPNCMGIIDAWEIIFQSSYSMVLNSEMYSCTRATPLIRGMSWFHHLATWYISASYMRDLYRQRSSETVWSTASSWTRWSDTSWERFYYPSYCSQLAVNLHLNLHFWRVKVGSPKKNCILANKFNKFMWRETFDA